MTAIIAKGKTACYLIPRHDRYVGRSLAELGEFSPLEFDTWRPYLKPGHVVVDVGANLGAHTIAFAQTVTNTGAVIAFEPQRGLYNMLCGSLALNSITNVDAYPYAVGRESGSTTIPPIDYDQPNNFGGVEMGNYPDGLRVRQVTIDSLHLANLDFLKIDVEGMELDVILGAERTLDRLRPVISAEADRDFTTKAYPLLARLLRWGYRVWWHKPPLGPLWPTTVSINLLCLPKERTDLPDPIGFVTPAEG